jgi:hypothetical protein
LAAQEAEERHCYRSRLIKTPDRISEGPPPGGGLSVCALPIMLQRMSLFMADFVAEVDAERTIT